jgi:MraZ protein
MFVGEYHHAIDEKGRLAIPSKFRQAFKGGVVVTRGLDHCLFLYTRSEWIKLAKRLASLPVSQANSRAFARLMLAGAMDGALDKQGRVIVPDYLRKYAGLGKQTVVAGLYDRLEIWDKEKWDEYTKRTEAASNDIAERLGELGV